jgi:hypothetical protein
VSTAELDLGITRQEEVRISTRGSGKPQSIMIIGRLKTATVMFGVGEMLKAVKYYKNNIPEMPWDPPPLLARTSRTC